MGPILGKKLEGIIVSLIYLCHGAHGLVWLSFSNSLQQRQLQLLHNLRFSGGICLLMYALPAVHGALALVPYCFSGLLFKPPWLLSSFLYRGLWPVIVRL
jgi:hypothetical protein